MNELEGSVCVAHIPNAAAQGDMGMPPGVGRINDYFVKGNYIMTKRCIDQTTLTFSARSANEALPGLPQRVMLLSWTRRWTK